jgi:hypothetical protein
VGEIARCGISAIAVAFNPVVAEGLRFTIPALLLSFAFSFPTTFAASLRGPALLPEPLGSFFMNFSFSSFAGWIPRAVAAHTATVTLHLSHAWLCVTVRDGGSLGVLSSHPFYSFRSFFSQQALLMSSMRSSE